MNQHPHTLTLALTAVLRPLIVDLGGVLDVASDPNHLLELLQVSPQRFRVILLWGGYATNDNAALGVGTDRLEVVIQCAKGLHFSPAQAQMIARPGGTPPLLELIEQVRQWICAARYPVDAGTDPNGYSLSDSAWLIVEGIDTLQHQLTFTLNRALTYETNILEVPLI